MYRISPCPKSRHVSGSVLCPSPLYRLGKESFRLGRRPGGLPDHQLSRQQVMVDVVVVGLAVARVFTSFPFVSGHTLFLTYAIGSSRSRVTVVTASLVMLQVIYLKYFVWHDVVTSTSGIILGGLAAYLVTRIQRHTLKDSNDG